MDHTNRPAFPHHGTPGDTREEFRRTTSAPRRVYIVDKEPKVSPTRQILYGPGHREPQGSSMSTTGLRGYSPSQPLTVHSRDTPRKGRAPRIRGAKSSAGHCHRGWS